MCICIMVTIFQLCQSAPRPDISSYTMLEINAENVRRELGNPQNLDQVGGYFVRIHSRSPPELRFQQDEGHNRLVIYIQDEEDNFFDGFGG